MGHPNGAPRIACAILRDEHVVVTVSTLAPESMGFGEVSLSLPTVIARDGVSRVIPVSLSQPERKALEASAETLKRYIALLNTPERAFL